MAIIGDTSDEYTTEAETSEANNRLQSTSVSRPLAATPMFTHKFAPTHNTAIISPIR